MCLTQILSAQWHWDLGEWFFTLLWTCEMVVKMFLMGLRGYASNYKNLFDATITIVGLVCAHLRLRLHATTDAAVMSLTFMLLAGFGPLRAQPCRQQAGQSHHDLPFVEAPSSVLAHEEVQDDFRHPRPAHPHFHRTPRYVSHHSPPPVQRVFGERGCLLFAYRHHHRHHQVCLCSSTTSSVSSASVCSAVSSTPKIPRCTEPPSRPPATSPTTSTTLGPRA